MQFPGYWVFREENKVIIITHVFDETELDPDTGWKEAWQNRDPGGDCKGFVENRAAVSYAAKTLAKLEGKALSAQDLEQIWHHELQLVDGRGEFSSVSEMTATE